MQDATKNAHLVAQKLNLRFDSPSVQLLEQFIESQRAQSFEIKTSLTQTLGCFLGECIIQTYGGSWQYDDHGHLGVYFDPDNAVFPLERVREQFEQGLDASVYRFYTLIPQVFHLR